MPKKVALVTGSNRGIGLCTVKNLCLKYKQLAQDVDVFLCARDLDQGIEAANKLKEQFSINPKVHQLAIDDQDSVMNLRNFLEQQYTGLDVLVNNAAIAYPRSCSDIPFVEQTKNTINVNYRSTANLCDALFPLLRPHARVINVSSQLGMLNRVKSPELKAKFLSPSLTREDLDNLAQEYLTDVKEENRLQKGWPSPYAVSKILVNLLTETQQKLFLSDSRDDLVVNSVHPGHCATKLNNFTGIMSPEDGSRSSVFAATIPPHSEPRGAFIWHDCRLVDWTSGEIK